MWNQVYNPFSNEALSTLVAAIPVVTLLALIASGKVKAHLAAVIALAVAITVAVYAFTMPGGMAVRAAYPVGFVTALFQLFLNPVSIARERLRWWAAGATLVV